MVDPNYGGFSKGADVVSAETQSGKRTLMRTDILYDDGRLFHACEGERIVPFDPGTFLVWTKCGRDVPANQGFVGVHWTATCPKCKERLP